MLTPQAAVGGEVRVSVRVTNTGGRDGEEVVQLYVRDLLSGVTRPVRELKGFRKVMLRAGESREVTFTLTPDDLSFWRLDKKWGQEPGDYHVWAGHDSDCTLGGSFRITERFVSPARRPTPRVRDSCKGAAASAAAPFSVPGGTVRMSRKNPFGDVSDKRFRGMAGLSQIFSTFGGQNSTQ